MLAAFIDRVNHWDVFFFTSIFRLNGRRLFLRIMPFVSAAGDGYLYPVIAASMFFLAPDIAPQFLLAACIAYAIELPLYKLMKQKIRRSRPFHTLDGVQRRVVPHDSFSFPSGHTAAAFIMAGLVGYFFPLLGIPAYAAASLISFSRIYLGVHYPTDILAGIVLGSLSVLTGIAVAV